MKYTLDAIEEKVRLIVAAHLGVDPGRVAADTHLKEALNADSLDAVTIASAIEREFNIDVNDSQLPEFQTPADIARRVMEGLEAAGLRAAP